MVQSTVHDSSIVVGRFRPLIHRRMDRTVPSTALFGSFVDGRDAEDGRTS